jgi:protein TonB
MSEQIRNIKLKFSCTADWDSMPVVDGVKSCEHCSKKVYDFTGSKQDEFLRILSENNNSICGRFLPEQMAVSHSILPTWKKWVSAALVLVGINLFNSKGNAQEIKQNANNHTKSLNNDLIVGDVESINTKTVNSYPHYDNIATLRNGNVVWEKFLKENLHYKKGMIDGKVWVSFDVNKDGSIGNFKIMRELSAANDAEVIRVLKLSPKWKPATYKGKPVVSTYTLPISFKK